MVNAHRKGMLVLLKEESTDVYLFCFEGPFLPLNKFTSWSSTVSLKILEI